VKFVARIFVVVVEGTCICVLHFVNI